MLLYIDPGTGSMLFTILIGVLSAGVFFVRALIVKIRFAVSGGKAKDANKNAGKLDYVIFSDSKRYWNVFKPICDEFEKRKTQVYYYTASPDDPALSEKYDYVKCEFIGEGNKAYARLNMMKAKICLSTTPGLDVLQWKRSKNTDFYVHIFHAVDEGLGYRMFGMDYYDAVLLTGAFQEENIRKLEDLRHLSRKETVVTGSTYMDELKKKAENKTTAKNEETLILLAPSWGPSSILNRYGEKIIDALIETGYNIAVRPHPQMAISDQKLLENLKEKYPDNDKFSWNADNDNFDILSKADVMITDFSGIIFDYCLVFDKPLIYADTSMNLDPYDASWIDEPLWRFEVLPKLGVKLSEEEFGNMKGVIDNLMSNDEFRIGRKEVKETAWQCVGESAKLTVDYLMKKHEELAE